MIMMVREQELIDQGRDLGREEGREEGRDNERVSVIRKLVEQMHFTCQDAMNFIGISPVDQPKYLEKLEGLEV